MKIQQIVIKRKQANKWGVDGYMTIGGAKVCDTVEHPTHHLPSGRYIIKVLKSSKLHRLAPAIFSTNDEPLSAIIMPGNGAMAIKDGSIIVGERLTKGVVVQTAEVFAKTIDRLDKAYKRNELIQLKIIDCGANNS